MHEEETYGERMRRVWRHMMFSWAVVAFHAPQLWLGYFLFIPRTGTGGPGDALFNAFLMLAWGAIHSILARDFCKKVLARAVGEDFVKLVFVSVAGITQCFLLRKLEI